MESMRDLQKQIENLKKSIEAKAEIANKRNEILTAMLKDSESESPKGEERTNRFEGYYSYIITYKLEDMIEERNWFAGVVLSAAILEDVGKRKLKRLFKEKIDEDKIMRLTIEQTIMMLFASGLIEPKIYHKLIDIKKVRNDLAHDSHQAMSSFMLTGSTKGKDCISITYYDFLFMVTCNEISRVHEL
jgi:hypothetical protein